MLKKYIEHILTTEALFITACMAATLAVTLLSAYFHTGYWSAFLLATGMFTIMTVFAFVRKDDFLKRLLLFGLVAGCTELFADKWLVQDIQSLVYPAGEPRLWASPNYMPFAWAVVLVQTGYLGWLISNKIKMIEAMGLCLVIGIFFIPVFEQCAYWAKWWYYNPCKMLLNTPWYIIFAEGIICFFLPAIFFLEIKNRWFTAILFGVFEGLVIFGAYWLTYHLFE